MNETNLSPRQTCILTLITQSRGISRLMLEEMLEKRYPASKPTIARDLASLVGKKLIKPSGKARSTVYLPFVSNPLLQYFDLEQYFALEVDQRVHIHKRFDFSVFTHLSHLFSEVEKKEVLRTQKSFDKETKNLALAIYKKELERFIIELSWKSSKIEGNTYSLLDTEQLIKERIEASGHPKSEAIMILNHKATFEAILSNKRDFKTITLSDITQLHNSMVKDLSVVTGIRKDAVGITGTAYRPLDNSWQIREALEKAITAINRSWFPLEKALLAIVLISWIQPCADGNKRTGRMLANALLLANDYYPLSYRSVDDILYKKALILFYEQHSAVAMKKILLDQYRFAQETYFVSRNG